MPTVQADAELILDVRPHLGEKIKDVEAYDLSVGVKESHYYELKLKEGGKPVNKFMRSVKLSFNEKGNLIEAVWYISKDIIDGKKIYSYNKDGSIVEEVTYKDKDSLIPLDVGTKRIWTFNPIKNITEAIMVLPNGNKSIYFRIFSDNNNKPNREIVYLTPDKVLETTIERNPDKKFNTYYSPFGNYVLRYNNKGLIDAYLSDNRKVFYKYQKFDDKGNWIIRIDYENAFGNAKNNHEPSYAVKRIIQYY